jgi:hypothetical protein
LKWGGGRALHCAKGLSGLIWNSLQAITAAFAEPFSPKSGHDKFCPEYHLSQLNPCKRYARRPTINDHHQPNPRRQMAHRPQRAPD